VLVGVSGEERRIALGFYDRSRLPTKDPAILIEDKGGLELLVVQRELFDKLVTGRLALREGQLVIDHAT
jgi:hypothetical protein